MLDEKIISSLLIIMGTIIPVLIPYTYFLATNNEYIMGQLSPVCLSFQQSQSAPFQTTIKDIKTSPAFISLHYDYQLCMSCLSYDNIQKQNGMQNTIPNQFKITIRQINNQYKVNDDSKSTQDIYSQNESNHDKKILAIEADVKHIDKILQCKDMIQLLNYNIFINNGNGNNNENNIKATLIDTKLANIKIDTQINSIKQLAHMLSITLSPSFSSSQFYLSKSSKNIGIVQLIKHKIQQQNQHQREPSSFSMSSTYKFINDQQLLQYQYPSQQITQQSNILLKYLCIIEIIILISLFLYKYYKYYKYSHTTHNNTHHNNSNSNSHISSQIVINITVLFGIYLSLLYYRYNTNNYYINCSQLLFMVFIMYKFNINRINITIFVILNFIIIYLQSVNVNSQIYNVIIRQQQIQFIQYVKMGIYLLIIFLIVWNNYNNVQLLPFTIYVCAVWIFMILFTLIFYVWNDFKSLIAKYQLFIMSVTMIQMIGKVKMEKFSDFGSSSLRKFQEIKEFQEMEQQVDQQIHK